jgi:hypothetical protein
MFPQQPTIEMFILYHGMVTTLFNVVPDEPGSKPNERYAWRIDTQNYIV